jgi:hypothetical protein
MEPDFRCGTRKAIDELAVELNLPNENWMQDWPIEVVVPSDIQIYIDHYDKLTDDDKKFVLMEGILDAIEYQPTEELFLKYFNRVRQILDKDFAIHEYTIHSYACLDTETIEDCYKLTPGMREIWTNKTTNR